MRQTQAIRHLCTQHFMVSAYLKYLSDLLTQSCAETLAKFTPVACLFDLNLNEFSNIDIGILNLQNARILCGTEI